MRYSGVVFDLDGTLADTLDDIADSMNRILVRCQYPVHPVTDYKLMVGRGLDNLVGQALPEEARQDAIITDCLAQMIEDYNKNCLVKTHLYDGILEMIRELQKRSVKLAVFSNKAEPLTIKITDHLLGNIPFVKIIGARPDLPKKPDPTGALLISKEMGVPPGDMIYVGDSDVDMITANRAGMYASGVLWGFRTRDELLANGAKTLLAHPFELLTLFNI